MATEQDDSDIPESGGVFTFGKSKFAENLPNKFWIRNDLVTQAACGDQHTVLFAESGRVFVFGDNSYGQLGLGNTKSQTKPSCVKALKGEQVSVIGCGANHTLVSTSSGLLFAFGHNTDHQCGHDDVTNIESPTEVPLQKPLHFKQLCGGNSHSVGLEKNGTVYVWGDNAEGQLGLGDDIECMETPTKLPLDEKVLHVACGYYHTAVVTASGALYTFGEEEGGKLGQDDSDSNTIPVRVDIEDRIVWASCGGKHTAAVTAKGEVYTFGEGSSGQLGLGTSVMESSKPTPITAFKNIKIKYTSCGENFTAAISEKGQLYTFGDGRHGKLALGAENFSNQFRPFRVPRFAKFEVTEVSCGGCHTIALAHKKDEEDEDEELLDPLNSTFANSVRLSTDVDLNASISARDRRRAKESPEPLSRTLPPLTASTRGLPPLNSTYTTGKLRPVQSSTLPNSLDKRKLPNARFSKDDVDEEDSNLSDSPEEDSADEMLHKKLTQQTFKSKTQPSKKSSKDRLDSDVSVTPEGSSEEEGNSPSPQSLKNQRQAMKVQSEKIAVSKGKPTPTKRSSKGNLSPIIDEDYRFSRRSSREEKSVAAKNKKNKNKVLDSDEEVDSALDDSEDEEPTPKSKGKKEAKSDKKGKVNKKKSKQVSDEEEESEEETEKARRVKKSKLSIFGKNKKAPVDFSDDEEDEEEEEEEEKPKPSKSKGKDSKKKKKKVVDSDDEEEDEEEEEKEEKGKAKEKNKQSNDSKPEEKPPEEKKSRACIIL